MWVIYSAKESYEVDEPMFWDNEAGWTTLGCATTFTEKETTIYRLPQSIKSHILSCPDPDESRWMTVEDAQVLVNEFKPGK